MRMLHISAGLVALVAGAIALYAAKGSRLHRRSGMVFVIAMLVMTSSAVFMAAWLRPNRVNVVAGVLTFYLVSTALLSVRRTVEQTPGLLTGLMMVAFVNGAYAASLALEALTRSNGSVDGIPAPPLFMFAVVGLSAAILDARLLWAGSIQGAHRLARHLWRMTFALWIATASFFLGQAKLFPEPVRNIALLAIPVLLVLLTLFYWLVRVFIKPLKTRSAA